MKFNVKRPSHYLIYSIFFINLLLSFFFYLFNKKQKKRIILFGHTLDGNILDLYKQNQSFKHEIYYLSFSYKDYKENTKERHLYVYSTKDVLKVVKAKVFIATHGIPFHTLFNLITKIKYINIGHGILNVFNKNNPMIPDDYFHSYWLPTKFEKNIREKNYKKNIPSYKVTGWLRTENLIKNYSQDSLKKKYKLTETLGLFAPSAVHDYKNNNKESFYYRNIEFLKLLDKLSDGLNVKTIFKPHYNNYVHNEIEKEVLNFIKRSNNLIYFKELQTEELNELFSISDFLITDYSSLFVDYLLLKRPILFLDVPTRWDGFEYTEYLKNEYINIIKTFETFKESFNNIFNNHTERNNLDKLSDKIYGSILSEDTLRNYKSDIATLLNKNINEI